MAQLVDFVNTEVLPVLVQIDAKVPVAHSFFKSGHIFIASFAGKTFQFKEGNDAVNADLLARLKKQLEARSV